MTLVELARAVFQTAENLDVPYMAVGAIAAGLYGIPRATNGTTERLEKLMGGLPQ